ncbi:MAG: DUF362 domain-containing protein [Anaerolineae bacterium]|nr:DUF362 domain-containing protein [Anaerolineae bacterium]
MDKSRVSLVQGHSRRDNIAAALEAISARVSLEGVRRVLVKPNFVSTSDQAASTHVDAVRAVLDFIRARYDGPIVVAEGAAISPTFDGFRNFGYEALVDEYAAGAGVELLDLNAEETVPVQVYDRRLRPLAVRLARTAAEAGVYRISVGPPKTHDCVIVTLAIKNMVMGALVNPKAVRGDGGMPGGARRVAHLIPRSVWRSRLAEWAKGALLGRQGGSSKMAMHQGFPAMNLNLALVAALVWPHLAVIDGWQGREGNGPGAGDPVDWRVALAGTDPLAVDVLTAHLMGFEPGRVGYLQYCAQMGLGVGAPDQIDVVGNVTPGQARRSFKPHPTYQRQLQWRLEGAGWYLERARLQTAV